MPLLLLSHLLLFFVVSFGLAWPLAARLSLDPAEKLCASVLLSLLATYVIAFAIFLLGCPTVIFWALPLLAAIGLVMDRRTFLAVARDPAASALLRGQLLVSGWCVGWLFFIANYSGGGWTSDWYEHWERAQFFLDRWPLDSKFLGLYALPARPPLANVVTGAFLALTPKGFAQYQLFTALLNSMAFLPAALLVRRFHSRLAGAGSAATAVVVLAVLLMLNPSFVENATFAWTKLIAVFFILSGLYFFLRALDADVPRPAGPLCAVALAAGVLAHYSAGPYVLWLAVAWPIVNRRRWSDAAFWRETVLMGGIGALLLATWFGWSLGVYGAHTTFLSNSSVTVKEAQAGNQWLKIGLNLRDTFVPHFLRPQDGALIAQTSTWGYWRDWFFQLYQLNLFLIFGSVGWLVLLRETGRGWRETLPRSRWFWAIFAGSIILLGVAVHGARDTWGLAHICLQALLVLGLAYLAARWGSLGRGWRMVVVAGAALDFCLGIALHFAVQSYALDRWLTPRRTYTEIVKSYSESSLMNAVAKFNHQLGFFSDVYRLPGPLVIILLAAILAAAILLARRRPAS